MAAKTHDQCPHYATVSTATVDYAAVVCGVVIAQTDAAVILQECRGDHSYPPVVYFPKASIKQGLLRHSARRTVCPIKGEATYFALKISPPKKAPVILTDVAWSYPDPMANLHLIAGHVAFYADRVTISEIGN